MIKKPLFLIITFNFIFSQNYEKNIFIEEKSLFWKKDADKLILNNGDLFYGEYIGMKNKNVLFKVEFNNNPNSFNSSEIRHLVLANGKTIIRNNKDLGFGCAFLWLFISIYFYSFHDLVN